MIGSHPYGGGEWWPLWEEGWLWLTWKAGNADSLQVNGNVLKNKYKCRETLNREGSESVSLKPFRFGVLYYRRGEDLFCHLASWNTYSSYGQSSYFTLRWKFSYGNWKYLGLHNWEFPLGDYISKIFPDLRTRMMHFKRNKPTLCVLL